MDRAVADDCMDAGDRATQGAVADDCMDAGGRATQGAVADDCMDAGGRATQGAVAEALAVTQHIDITNFWVSLSRTQSTN
jgi:hypothetical protein